MRRQGSSCMLLPKSGDASKTRSVTIINREDLPSYSCERFYLLSELQQRAHSSVFLSDHLQEDNSTQGTTSTAPDDDSDLTGEHLGQFALLYLFWKPDMTDDSTVFIEQHILPQVQQLQSLRTVVTSMPSLDRPSISGIIHRRKNEDSQVEVDHYDDDDAKDEEGEATISIYIVVDRLCACGPVDASDPLESTRKQEQLYHNEEIKIEDLAKKVAIHEQLRDLCEGITVGLSNHERCAPGLEACADAVAWGAKERRTALASMKTEDDGRSALGIVANEPNDLLGLQSESTTDAAQGVMQMRLSTEWNGQGNLKSFAERAQSFWRQQHGLVDIQKLTCRRIISRKRRLPAGMNPGEMNDFFINGLALLFIVGYLFFHLRNDMHNLIYYFDPSNWDNFIQRLRSL
ncbi:hypothetical protein FisN_11Lh250 [Fistulifera solaris]|uniref:Uncharacterized protein n=1 Tax=Fistulifera solaris TaxID=1519565 RepID=A0A1Z5J759_FISSO|nr:hypothetical protein FisN_11Lh250 [Fistulifera solaris]|eukprot:GAX09776.1 hypothetical protein FisN_11Lh250 [Fistulifera solaris]